MKICIFCENWGFVKGFDGSDEEGSLSYEEECLKELWNIENIEDENEYREIIKQAETCKFYIPIN